MLRDFYLLLLALLFLLPAYVWCWFSFGWYWWLLIWLQWLLRFDCLLVYCLLVCLRYTVVLVFNWIGADLLFRLFECGFCFWVLLCLPCFTCLICLLNWWFVSCIWVCLLPALFVWILNSVVNSFVSGFVVIWLLCGIWFVICGWIDCLYLAGFDWIVFGFWLLLWIGGYLE